MKIQPQGTESKIWSCKKKIKLSAKICLSKPVVPKLGSSDLDIRRHGCYRSKPPANENRWNYWSKCKHVIMWWHSSPWIFSSQTQILQTRQRSRLAAAFHILAPRLPHPHLACTALPSGIAILRLLMQKDQSPEFLWFVSPVQESWLWSGGQVMRKICLRLENCY